MKIYYIILTLLTFQSGMNDHKYHLLLGGNVNYLKFNNHDYLNKSDMSHSYSFSKNPLNYLNNTINNISFYFNEEETITKVYVDLSTLIDKSFFDDFVNIYGEPNHILVQDEVLYDSKHTGEFGQTVRKTHSKAREGTFDENPIFIIWFKDGIKIQVLMKYAQNVSEIAFSTDDRE